MTRGRAVFLISLLGFPTLWFAGVWMFDAVRVFAGLVLLSLLFWRRARGWVAPELGLPCKAVLLTWALAYFGLLISHMLARLQLGLQGIDFAIFSQVIENIGRHGVATGSLFAHSHSDNFLWHHFCPILYVPGALVFLGLSAPVAAVLVHAVGAAIGFGALFGAARARLGIAVGAGVTFAAFLSGSVRPELFWGIHDETFAIAAIGLGLWAWLSGRFVVAAVAIALTGLCKESFFPFMAWFAVVALVFHRDFHAPETASRARRALGPLIPLGMLATVVYFFLQPQLAGKSFDHFEKLASTDVLLSARVWAEKLLFLGSVLLGSCGLGLLTRKGRVVLALAAPFVGIVAISGYAEMWRPFGYYALIPSVIGFFAAVVSLEALRARAPALVSAPALVFAVALALSFGTALPSRDVRRAIREGGFSADDLAWIPEDARVIADPAGALALLRVSKLKRLWAVGQQPSIEPFDYVVLRPGGYEEVSDNLKAVTVACHPSGGWTVLCPAQ